LFPSLLNYSSPSLCVDAKGGFLLFLFLITEQATGQKVKVIQADFTENSVYENIEKSLQGLDIGVLGESLKSVN